jgi:type I restriction enzyme S subunit
VTSVKLKPLGEQAEHVVVGYVGPSTEHFSDVGVPFLRTGNVGRRKIIHEGMIFVTNSFHKSQKKSQLKTGDVVITRVISESINCAIIPKDLEGSNCGNIIIVRPGDRIDPSYLTHLLSSRESQKWLMSRQVGSAQSVVNTSVLKSWEIPVLPIEEQRRIAAILDKADALRAKRREALAQLDRLAQSIFVEMFGDPATNPKGWPERAMSELFETSPIFGTMIPPSVDGGEWLSLRVANIQDWRLDLTDQKFVTLPANMVERHSVMDGDLLLARAIASQEHLGKAVVATPSGRKWAFDSHLMRLRFNHAQALPEFVRHLWMTTGGRSLFLKATRRSAVQFNINTKEMNSLVLPMPPVQLQREFVNRVLALDSMRQKQNLALIEFDGLFATLQHRAFQGEL